MKAYSLLSLACLEILVAISLKALASGESRAIGRLQGGVLLGQREHEFLWCDAWFAFLETSVYPEQAGEMREGRVIIIPSFLTLKKGSTFLTKPLFNSLYAPFGSPSSGGQKPSGTRGCNRPTVLGTATLQGWRTNQRSTSWLCGMGPPC